MNPPDLSLIPGGKTNLPPPALPDLLELPQPKTAAEAFGYLSIRAAEKHGVTKDPKWAMISGVLRQLGEFSAPWPHSSARHVAWGYRVVLKRVPKSREETGPLVEWMSRIPALATDKAAAAPLLFHYLARCAGEHVARIPIPKGGPGAWEYDRAGLTIPCSNEEAYGLGKQRHFWTNYQGRLLYIVGCLLQEMAGVPLEVEKAPVAQAAPAVSALDPTPAAVSAPLAEVPLEPLPPENPAQAQDLAPAAET